MKWKLISICIKKIFRYYKETQFLPSKVIRFEDILAISNIHKFSQGIYNTFEEFKNSEEKVYFQIRGTYKSKLGKIIKDDSLYSPVVGNSWTLDFKDAENWLEDPDNFLNVHRLYSALIDGNTLTFSKDEDNFDRGTDDWIAELTLNGVCITKTDFRINGEHYRQGKVNDFINEFFKNTDAPRTVP